ncbi:MAG: gamma-glutamylcyclotransferase [Blastocatellia bacterium]|nr:gamma-glutamylcyclotransferase [Blastocatellia bacterium]
MERYYFAYGSNLNIADWHRWCSWCGYAKDLLKPISTGYLPDRTLAFSLHSESRFGGVLDVVPKLGHTVSGVIYKVKESGWQALDAKEGAPNWYRRFDTYALTSDAKEVAVSTYEVRPNLRSPFVPPHSDYLEIVSQGLRSYGLDDLALNATANQQNLNSLNHFFFYGTLMTGQIRHKLLKPFSIKLIKDAKTYGKLIDLGSYPGFLLRDQDKEREQWVYGELVELGNIEQAVTELDQVEGFSFFGDPDLLYRRALTNVYLDDGVQKLAWIYVYNQPSSERLILSGNWREFSKL